MSAKFCKLTIKKKYNFYYAYEKKKRKTLSVPGKKYFFSIFIHCTYKEKKSYLFKEKKKHRVNYDNSKWWEERNCLLFSFLFAAKFHLKSC